IGRVVVATWLPHHNSVLQAIQETGLELHVIFNRSAVMVLPTGVNKGLFRFRAPGSGEKRCLETNLRLDG
ncbi:MAG TPA: hypothetical protein VHD62_06715, partial [Opitutaceae bacterium]|nr:hypothetical protein [Opitutaceae bacterium]